MRKIFYIGDSTVQFNKIDTYPQTGMSQVLPIFTAEGITVCPHAKNGRSTKSFLDEGRFRPVQQEMGEGDFLFIQFGHNDEKQADPNRYTEAYGDYQVNLEKFVNVARNRKAYPVLITPLCRRQFDESGVLQDTHGEYPEAMRQVAKRLDVPLIDLCTLSFDIVAKSGNEESKKWFMNFPAGLYPNFPDGKEDNSHLRPEGAMYFAGIIANELKKLGGIYEDLLLEAPDKPMSSAIEP